MAQPPTDTNPDDRSHVPSTILRMSTGLSSPAPCVPVSLPARPIAAARRGGTLHSLADELSERAQFRRYRGIAVALSACRACTRTGDLGATGDSRRLGRMPMRRNACRFVLRASECPADSGAPRHRPSVVRRATGRLEHSRVMRDSARSTSSERQSRSRRGHRPRRHAAWTSRSTCRGSADRGSARPVSGRCRARGRRATGLGQPPSGTR
jgi:hypothetical protein